MWASAERGGALPSDRVQRGCVRGPPRRLHQLLKPYERFSVVVEPEVIVDVVDVRGRI